MKQPISLKKLILEAQQTTLIEDDTAEVTDRSELLDNDIELANQYRIFLRAEWARNAPNIWNTSQVAAHKKEDPNNYDDLKPYIDANDLWFDFIQSDHVEAMPAWKARGNKINNVELKEEAKKTHDYNPIDEQDWWWTVGIVALAVLGLGIFAVFRKWLVRSIVKAGKSAWSKYAKRNLAKNLDQAASSIPEGKLFNWVEQQQAATLAGSKQKMPKWAYDDLAESLAQEAVRREVREMVMGVCIGKIKNGTMNAETFLAKLPAVVKTPANVARIRSFAAEAKAARAIEKAKRKPRPKI